jgi:hypothetical protein
VSSRTLTVESQPSLQLAWFLIVAHTGAGVSVMCADFAPVGQVVGLCILASSFGYLYGVHVLRIWPHTIVSLEWRSDDRIVVGDAAGSRIAGVSLVSYYVHPALVVLNFDNTEKRLRTMILCSDSAAADVLRQLRVRLRLPAEVW